MICADCGKGLRKGKLSIKTASGYICRKCYDGYQASMERNDRIVNKKEKIDKPKRRR